MHHKHFLIFPLLLLLLACKSKKDIPTISTQENIENSIYWNLEDIKIESVSESVNEYLVYTLNEDLFFSSLQNDTLLLPDLDGKLNAFKMGKTETMSPELAEKFPEIKTFKGRQINNPLCEARITFKNKQPDITVLCNNVTYLIKKTNNEEYYILYDKQAINNSLSE